MPYSACECRPRRYALRAASVYSVLHAKTAVCSDAMYLCRRAGRLQSSRRRREVLDARNRIRSGGCRDGSIERSRWIQFLQLRTQLHIQDIEGHLKGGIPTADVDALEPYWKVCPQLRETLFKTNRPGYF